MKIFGTGFISGKQLPAQTTKKVQDLLLKMNSNTADGKVLFGLTTKTGSIVDLNCVPQPVQSIWSGRAAVCVDKLELQINPKNGEILHSKIPLFLTWKRAYKKVEKFINDLQTNFDNPSIVKKGTFTLLS